MVVVREAAISKDVTSSGEACFLNMKSGIATASGQEDVTFSNRTR